MSELFAPLPRIAGGFKCVCADVASRFRSNSEAKPGRNAIRHYKCHPMETFATLPVGDVVAPDALLWFWTTGPLLAISAHIKVMRAWGFESTAMAFVWVKLNPKAPSLFFTERDLFFRPGLTTRKNAEYVVLGRRGRPERLAADVFEVILAPRREHSRKPSAAYARIERYCAGPRLDLFCRETREGWVPYGNEADKFDPPGSPPPVLLGEETHRGREAPLRASGASWGPSP